MQRRSANIIFWGVFLSVFSTVVGMAWYFIHNYGETILITLETNEITEPRQAIVFHFSQSMRSKSFTGKIALTPDIPINVEWHERENTLTLTPRIDWPIGKDINIALDSLRGRLFGRSKATNYVLSGPKSPAITHIWPERGAKDVLLGIEDPIRITLDRSSRNYFLDFRIEPPVSVVYRNNPEKTAFEILPQTPLAPGEKYSVSVWAKWKQASDETYQHLTETFFSLAPPAPTTWNRDLAIRVEEARRYTRAKKDGKYIDINLAAQIMTLFENGRAVDAFVVSSGMRGMETPKGEFSIQNKADRPWSKKYSLYMPYWQAITPDGLFGIHELPEWPGGYKEGANHLGTPVSHGCVRLGVGPAKRVYEWTEIGTPVLVY